MYPVLAERSFVPCGLIMWLWLMQKYKYKEQTLTKKQIKH